MKQNQTMEKHFSRSLFDWDSTSYFFFWLRKYVARILLKSVLYLLKHYFRLLSVLIWGSCLSAEKLENISTVQSKASETVILIPQRKSDLSAVTWEGISDVYLLWNASPLVLMIHFSWVSLALWLTQCHCSNSAWGGTGRESAVVCSPYCALRVDGKFCTLHIAVMSGFCVVTSRWLAFWILSFQEKGISASTGNVVTLHVVWFLCGYNLKYGKAVRPMEARKLSKQF